MSDLLALVREDLREFAGYSSARRAGVTGSVWLNANESPWLNPVDGGSGVNRYPDPQPARLREALAGLYGCQPAQVLVGRGSDEAIDLLVRALCRPGVDGVVVSPPVFGMYEVSARLQGAPVYRVPLVDDDAGFHTDIARVGDVASENSARIVFLCSPANPTGQALPLAEIEALAQRLRGLCLVVVDEAYGDYCSQGSAVTLMAANDNIAVLRTLSKAHALAAARIGTLIADERLIAVLRNYQAPYPLPAPCVELAMAALTPYACAVTRERVAMTVHERERVRLALGECDSVLRVYPSQGNYLLVRFSDPELAFTRLLAAGVVVRDMRASPQLGDALRVSIGTPEENDLLLSALQPSRAAA